MKVLYVEATKIKGLLDKHTRVTLEGMELRVELETGRINLNFKSARTKKLVKP